MFWFTLSGQNKDTYRLVYNIIQKITHSEFGREVEEKLDEFVDLCQVESSYIELYAEKIISAYVNKMKKILVMDAGWLHSAFADTAEEIEDKYFCAAQNTAGRAGWLSLDAERRIAAKHKKKIKGGLLVAMVGLGYAIVESSEKSFKTDQDDSGFWCGLLTVGAGLGCVIKHTYSYFARHYRLEDKLKKYKDKIDVIKSLDELHSKILILDEFIHITKVARVQSCASIDEEGGEYLEGYFPRRELGEIKQKVDELLRNFSVITREATESSMLL